MHRNMGVTDRWARVVLAALGWWLAASIGYGSVGGIVVLVVAGILLVTAVAAFCPLYALFSFSTNAGRPHRSAA